MPNMDSSFKIYSVITAVMLYLLIILFLKPSKYKPASSFLQKDKKISYCVWKIDISKKVCFNIFKI